MSENKFIEKTAIAILNRHGFQTDLDQNGDLHILKPEKKQSSEESVSLIAYGIGILVLIALLYLVGYVYIGGMIAIALVMYRAMERSGKEQNVFSNLYKLIKLSDQDIELTSNDDITKVVNYEDIDEIIINIPSDHDPYVGSLIMKGESMGDTIFLELTAAVRNHLEDDLKSIVEYVVSKS